MITCATYRNFYACGPRTSPQQLLWVFAPTPQNGWTPMMHSVGEVVYIHVNYCFVILSVQATANAVMLCVWQTSVVRRLRYVHSCVCTRLSSEF